MNIEPVICPCCNHEFRVNVPFDKEIVDVFTASHILSSFTKKPNLRMLCPKCLISVYMKFA